MLGGWEWGVIGALVVALGAAIQAWMRALSREHDAEDRAERAESTSQAHQRINEEETSRDRSAEARDERLKRWGLK